MRTASRLLMSAGLVALACTAQAQPAPPIKPGLWEVQVERDGAEAKMPDMSERLKNMPPEQRAKIEEMMKARGIDMGAGGGKIRLCFDKESLSSERWAASRGPEGEVSCKTDFTTRSNTSWKWHSVCTQPYQSETNGEALFADAEHYMVKNTTTRTVQGQAKTTQMTLKSSYVSSDCGDVKPIKPGLGGKPQVKKPNAG
ncbi:DUF3617 domain-containing protein [Piscinibacter terrae]|nr:DUF3617 domain-containing protein [Albitalea terrae]